MIMLIVLALSGAAPTCAQPMPARYGMAHHAPKPGDCDQQAVAHDCLGCGFALPDAPETEAIAMQPIALAPIARASVPPVGTHPRQPLRPPQA